MIGWAVPTTPIPHPFPQKAGLFSCEHKGSTWKVTLQCECLFGGNTVGVSRVQTCWNSLIQHILERNYRGQPCCSFLQLRERAVGRRTSRLNCHRNSIKARTMKIYRHRSKRKVMKTPFGRVTPH
ncbi:hypothetical protein SRHO_G00286180 [Serrasalmus rhombeus]